MANCKITTIPNEFSQAFESVIEMLADIDVHYVELASMWGKNILDLNEEEENKVEKILNEYGTKASAIQTQIMKCHPRNSSHAEPNSKKMHADLEFNLSRIDRAIELAERFNTKNIVTYSYFDRDGITEENWKLLLQDYEGLVDKCKDAGKTMVLENEHDTYVALVDDIQRIMSHFNSPHLRWLFDTGNMFRRVNKFSREDYDKVGKFIGYW
ncbi:MAG: TIM barrel protein, partial [Candidatus Lokiarchaeota archaeon]|nr:TIM barrel protein [Candidatus Lokiarchaeota archaeon]